MASIDEIKRANPIAEVIGLTYELTQGGPELHARAHDSLKVNPEQGAFYWFAKRGGRGWSGDVITWVEHHHDGAGLGSPKAAIRWLCERAGLPLSMDDDRDVAERARHDALTVAADWAQEQLRGSKRAQDYVASRGWVAETIERARLGYTGDKPEAGKRSLSEALRRAGVDLESPVAVALVGFRGDVAGWAKQHGIQPATRWLDRGEIGGLPYGHLVYAHVTGGRVTYLSTRLASATEKAHHNLPKELAGPKQVYGNWLMREPAGARQWADLAGVVEGQADAIALGQLGVPALALAGVDGAGPWVTRLEGVARRFVGLDDDKAGRERQRALAAALGPRTTVVRWPAKDPAAWVAEQVPGAVVDARAYLSEQPTYVEWLAREAGQAENGHKDGALLQLAEVASKLDRSHYALKRADLAHLAKIKLGVLDGLVKAQKDDAPADEPEDDPDDLPEVQTLGQEMIADHFLDLLWDTTHKRFRLAIRYPDGRLGTANEIELAGTRYVPAEPSSLMGLSDTIIFPDRLNPGGVPLGLAELHQRIMGFAHKYFDCDSQFAAVAAYYIILTWLYDCFPTIGYLRMVGPYGVGKSRFADTYGYIAYRAIRAAGSSSVSPIFRTLHLIRGTLVMDEINAPDKTTNPELEMIFKLGSSKRSPAILRTTGDSTSLFPEGFTVYGPKIFGAIKRFNDPATDSRCITYKASLATTRTDIPKALQGEFDLQAQELRRELMTYRMAYWSPERQLTYEGVDQTLEPRSQQISAALFSLVSDDDVRGSITAMLLEQEGDNRAEREMSISAKALSALVHQLAQPMKAHGNAMAPYWDTRLTVLLTLVRNAVFDDEDAAPATHPDGTLNAQSPRNDKAHWANKLSSKKLAAVLKTDLGLNVGRVSWHPSKAYGVILTDVMLARLPALCRKYGVDYVAPNTSGQAPEVAAQQAGLQLEVAAEPEAPPVSDDEYWGDVSND